MPKEIKFFSKAGTVLKWTGRATGVFSVGYSYYQYTQGDISAGKFGLDATITGASFIPVVGWAIGAQYFIIDNTIGVENFTNIMINQANERVDMVNNGNWGMSVYPRFGQSVR